MKQKKLQKGQTLVALLVFMIMAVTITTTAVSLISTASTNASYLEQGFEAKDVAEAGAEDAILRLLRDPAFTNETISINGGTATVTVSGNTITSIGSLNNFIRKIQLQITYTNNILTVSSWKEVYN